MKVGESQKKKRFHMIMDEKIQQMKIWMNYQMKQQCMKSIMNIRNSIIAPLNLITEILQNTVIEKFQFMNKQFLKRAQKSSPLPQSISQSKRQSIQIKFTSLLYLIITNPSDKNLCLVMKNERMSFQHQLKMNMKKVEERYTPLKNMKKQFENETKRVF